MVHLLHSAPGDIGREYHKESGNRDSSLGWENRTAALLYAVVQSVLFRLPPLAAHSSDSGETVEPARARSVMERVSRIKRLLQIKLAIIERIMVESVSAQLQ